MWKMLHITKQHNKEVFPMTKFIASKNEPVCNIKGCYRPLSNKGLCEAHCEQFEHYGYLSKELRRYQNEVITNSNISEVLLYNAKGREIARTIIDTEDIQKIINYTWCLSGNGYAVSWVDGRMIYLHRFLSSTPEGMNTDHINTERLDNRKSNLRYATNAENSHNIVSTRGSSKYKGVCFLKTKKWPLKKPWLSYITCNKKKKYLGYFATQEEAATAYDNAAKELFGEFAKTNF